MVQSDHTPKMGNFLFVARTLDCHRQSKATHNQTTHNSQKFRTTKHKKIFINIKIPNEMHAFCLNLWAICVSSNQQTQRKFEKKISKLCDLVQCPTNYNRNSNDRFLLKKAAKVERMRQEIFTSNKWFGMDICVQYNWRVKPNKVEYWMKCIHFDSHSLCYVVLCCVLYFIFIA